MEQIQPLSTEIETNMFGFGIFGVLKKLEDEMSSLGVELSENRQVCCLRTIASDVFFPEFVVVGGHNFIEQK